MKTLLLSALLLLPCADLWAVSLKFQKKSRWRMQETAEMGGAINRTTLKYKVVRIFKDGAALTEAEFEKIEAGPSLKKLKTVSNPLMKQMRQHMLYTADGRVFQILAPPKAKNKAQMQFFSQMTNEYEMLMKAKTVSKFAAKRSPRDAYKLPLGNLKVGGKTSRLIPGEKQQWVIERLKDAKVGKTLCQVYHAKRPKGQVQETVWIDPKRGMVLKRTLDQGGKRKALITQRRL